MSDNLNNLYIRTLVLIDAAADQLDQNCESRTLVEAAMDLVGPAILRDYTPKQVETVIQRVMKII